MLRARHARPHTELRGHGALQSARELGRQIASRQWLTVNGGGQHGLMRAVIEGARELNGAIKVCDIQIESVRMTAQPHNGRWTCTIGRV